MPPPAGGPPSHPRVGRNQGFPRGRYRGGIRSPQALDRRLSTRATAPGQSSGPPPEGHVDSVETDPGDRSSAGRTGATPAIGRLRSVVSGGAHQALRPRPFPQGRFPRAGPGRVQNANHGKEAASCGTGPPPSHAVGAWRPRRGRSSPQVPPDGQDSRRDGRNYKLTGAHEYALEEAVRLKEKTGGRVVAVTLGPKRTEQMLREALAKGADEAVRIAWDDPAAFDAGKNARLLAAAVRTLPHDLVLTGVQSDDYVNSATGGLLAGILGLAHASAVTRVAVQGSRVEVACELEGGLQRVYTLPLPALLTIQFGANTPRYAPLPAIMKAARL